MISVLHNMLMIGPSAVSFSQSHNEMVCIYLTSSSAPIVTMYWQSADRSMHLMPLVCGFKNVRTGVADRESHTTSIESSPVSAVTIQRLLSEQAVAVILLQ